MLVNNKIEDKILSVDREGIKLEGNVLFYYAKIMDSCGLRYRFTILPTQLNNVD